MHQRPRYAVWLLMVLAGVLANCGGTGMTPVAPSPPPPAASPAPSVPPPPPLTATITITAAGVSPKDVEIAAGGRVTFINDDVRVHDIYSSPHTTHDDCPGVNAVGFLTAGQSRATDVLTVVRECGFHDHIDPNFEPMNGRIIIK